MRFAIYGIGGFGREVAPLARDYLLARAAAHSSEQGSEVVFVDDSAGRPSECNGYLVIGFEQLTGVGHRDRQVIIAVGDGRAREKIERRCIEAGLAIGNVSAPTTRVLDAVSIASGAVLCDGVILTSNITIGKSFQANLNSYVGHDCEVGDYVTFAPGVHCNGNLRIENYAYIGTGAMFVQGKASRPLVIGEGALIGMGAVVTKPVEPYTVVAGNPARPIRKLAKPED